MPTIVVSMQSICPCPKRSLDYALGQGAQVPRIDHAIGPILEADEPRRMPLVAERGSHTTGLRIGVEGGPVTHDCVAFGGNSAVVQRCSSMGGLLRAVPSL